MVRRCLLCFFFVALSAIVRAEGFDIGKAMEAENFWTTDPVLFVHKYTQNGFQFTSDQRESADSRLDGGVQYFDLPVFETRIIFGETGGIRRVELMLYTEGGTEGYEEFQDENGGKFRRRVRVEKSFTHDEFWRSIELARKKLTKPKEKVPKIITEQVKGNRSKLIHQASQQWVNEDTGVQSTLVWNYTQKSKQIDTFKPGFIRLTQVKMVADSSDKKAEGISAKTLIENVAHGAKGDVFIDGIPMVDQGAKGYCSVATSERVLKYFGIDVDEHEVAVAAGTTADNGTSTDAMRKAVEAIGRRYQLSTVIGKGRFDLENGNLRDELMEELKSYNKIAKKLKKPQINEDESLNMMVDPEVFKEVRVKGSGKTNYARFLNDIHKQIDRGIPIFWGVMLGIYPEPGLPQSGGGHMRLIIGYNDKKKEILYSDSWGAGHELKRMPAEWAWTITVNTIYLRPLR